MSESIPVPDEAASLFHVKQLPLAERYADWLTDQGVVRGLIGPREASRIWDRHLLNCAAVDPVFSQGSTVADVGSGAGLPGLVVAIARPDLSVTLIEPLLRRTTFLSEVVDDLELSNVEVIRGRADALHGSRRFDHVTSRAVAPLGRLLEWCMPLVAPDGTMVAMKGGSVEAEVVEASDVLARLGCAEPEVVQVGDGPYATSVLSVSWADPSQVGLVTPPAGPRSGRRDRRRGGQGQKRQGRR